MARKRNRHRPGRPTAVVPTENELGGTEKSPSPKALHQSGSEDETMVDTNKDFGVIRSNEDVALRPFEQDGETVLEVECGPNKAILYVSRLRQGSKGSCVSFQGSWLTPNEFQFVSGRETAKDWKRSIRHCGKSLKLLLNRGLFDNYNSEIRTGKSDQQRSSPKVAKSKPSDENVSPIKGAPAKFKIRKRRKQKKSRPGKRDLTSATNGKTNTDPLSQLDIQDENTTDYVTPASDSASHEAVEKEQTTDDIDSNFSLESTNVEQTTEGKDDEAASDTQTAEEQLEPPEVAIDSEPAASPEPAPEVDENSEEKATEERVTAKLTETVEATESEAEKLTTENTELKSPGTPETPEILTTLGLSARIRPADGPKTSPGLPDIDETKESVVEPIVSSRAASPGADDECVEPEMPTLLKEGEINGPEVPLSGSVTPFHAAVTPPPTPPSSSPKMADIKQDIPSEGPSITLDTHLKMSIERTLAEEDKQIPNKRTDEQTLLLQDALNSARRYKEQLHKQRAMKKHSPDTKAAKQQPKQLPTNTDIFDITKYMPQHYDHKKPTKTESLVSPKNSIPKHSPKPIPTSSAPVSSPRTSQPPSAEKRRKHSYSPMSLTSLSDRHSKINSDYLNAISTSFGPLVPGLDSSQLMRYSAAMFPGLHSLPFKDLKSMTGLSNTDHTPLYPLPFVPPAMHFCYPNPLVNMYSYAPLFVNGKEAKSRDSPKGFASPEPAPEKPRDNSESSKKRKRPSDETGVLDLSVKKQKYDNKINNNTVHDADSPLDFSMKCGRSQLHPHSSTPEAFRRTDSRVSSSPSYPRQSPKSGDRHSSNTSSSTSSTSSSGSSTNLWTDKMGSSSLGRSDVCTCSTQKGEDILNWTVDHVCQFLTVLDGCSQYVKTFQDQGISGRLLPFLTTQHLTRTLGMKVGPAFTLMQAVERKFREHRASVPCANCRQRAAIPVQM